MNHGIVIGIDFSDPSRRALEQGIALALHLDCPLTAVHAWNPSSWAGAALPEEAHWIDWIDEARKAAKQMLDAWVQLATDRGANASALFVEDGASAALLDLSRSADVIVLGRRGRAEIAHVLLGSVCERVVTGASCPVLTVPQRSQCPLIPERILVGVDYSAASGTALRRVAALHHEMKIKHELLVAHAHENERALWLATPSARSADYSRHLDRDLLQRWALARLDPGDSVEARIIEGTAEDGLVALANAEDCHWIALGVQGRTALASFLIGSTTHRILKLTDRPVLTIPNPTPGVGEATS